MPLATDSLRPAALDSFIGQERLKNVLSIAISGAKARHEGVRHSLFVGPPGLGKTTLANIIAAETNQPLITCSGTAVTKITSLATLLNQIPNDGAVLFCDEIHRLPRTIEEALYSVMEDFRLDVTTDKLHINMRLPKFTLVGATTRQGLITKPLQDRFGSTYHLSFYSLDELVKVVQRSAAILKLEISREAAAGIAQRAKRTPRIANNLLLQARDFALSYNIDQINEAVILGMMDMIEVDSIGLTRMDRLLLTTIIDKFNGGPVGLGTLATMMAEEIDVIERVYEPYMLQEHLIERTPKGRIVTDRCYAHLGLKPQATPITLANAVLVDDDQPALG